MPLKKVNDVRQVLKYLCYLKSTRAMYVLHNLHGLLSQYHDFIFSLNVNRVGASLNVNKDGASLISVGTKFHN